MREVWRPVPGFPAYSVSSTGRVRGARGKLLKPCKQNRGYLYVSLGRGNKRTVHSLVLLAFIGLRPPGAETLHRNDKKTDNRLKNLRYGTGAENRATILYQSGAQHWTARYRAANKSLSERGNTDGEKIGT